MERVKQKDQKIGKYEDGSEQFIGALIEMHRALGPAPPTFLIFLIFL
jgi:hypothetical protein